MKINFKLLGALLLLLEGTVATIWSVYLLVTTLLSDEQTKLVYWILALLSIQIMYSGIKAWENHKPN